MFEGEIVDPTQEIYQGMPVHTGHLKTVIRTHLAHGEYQDQLGTVLSYQARGLMLCNRGPTHIDAVRHSSVDQEAEPIDKLALKKCIRSAIYPDVSDVLQKTEFGREKVEDALNRSRQEIRKGDTVVFHTAQCDRYCSRSEYMIDNWRESQEARGFIIAQGCINFGAASLSPDLWLNTYPCHTVCSDRGVCHITIRCNLEKMAERRFVFIRLPLKIHKGTGSPIRAIAVFDRESKLEGICGEKETAEREVRKAVWRNT